MEKEKHIRKRTSRTKRFAARKPASDWRLISPAVVPEQERRHKPLLMKHWKYLWRQEFVELRRGTAVVGRGYIDEATNDASIIWIYLANGLGRIMLHQHDGIDIWRVDPRINAQPSQP